MNTRQLRVLLVGVVVWWALTPGATAQTLGSSIVGVLRDQTGAALPGVTVEVQSPALVGGVQSVVTDETGAYRFVDLRPGSYTLTFSLAGFQSVRHENLALRASFTATINIEMRPATVEETITVYGGTPVVDVRTNVSERSIDQTLLEEVPTSRGIFAVAALVPGMTTNTPDVGGSETHQLTRLSIHGSDDRDVSWNLDGLDVTGNVGTGGYNVTYYNQGLQEEVSVQSKGLPAEIGGGGVYMNMITKNGGNQFKGWMFTSYTGSSLQSGNVSSEQRARGMTAPAGVDSLLDINPTFGGPLKPDRLWFIGSWRYWRNNRFEANTFNPDGSQALDRQLLLNYSGKITAQVNSANRVSFFMDWNVKHREERRDRTSAYQFIAPEATKFQRQDGPVSNLRWTSTVRDNLLLEAGLSLLDIEWFLRGQPGVSPHEVPRLDLARSVLDGRVESESQDVASNRTVSVFASWFPTWKGAHTVRFGGQYNNAPYYQRFWSDLDLTARYRNGVPDSVAVWNTPVELRSRIRDYGFFIQDSWTIQKRLTLNVGARFESYSGAIDPQVAEAGAFVGERRTETISNVPNWSTVVPRMAFVFDPTGRGRTAIKANASKYMQKQGVSFLNAVNPMRRLSEVRSWTDRNADGIPQPDEIGPGRGELEAGTTVRLDPNLKRPYQWEYTATLEQQLSQNLGLTLSYFYRRYYAVYQTVNEAISASDYTPVTITSPLDGSPFTVYNQNPSSVGRFDNVVKNFAELGSNYHGFEVAFDKRFSRNVSLFGGYTYGEHEQCTSASNNPNDRINVCGDHPLASRHILNISGLFKLPGDIAFSVHEQYKTGQPLVRDFIVTRALVSDLTQVNQRVLLAPSGQFRRDNLSLLDLRLSKNFQLRNVVLSPTLDVYNALNENAALIEIETVGPALGQIARNVDGRTVRFAMKLEF